MWVLQTLSDVRLQAKSAGMVINTMGWIEGLGYDLLLHSIQTLKVSRPGHAAFVQEVPNQMRSTERH